MEQHKCGWAEALRHCNIDADFYIRRKIHLEDTLPWDIIDNHIEKKKLWSSFQKAVEDKMNG